MCLIAWRWRPDQQDPLVLLSNRDEFFERPTQAVMQWPGTRIWAGQDQQAGGTWLGVTSAGRLAAITNHRSFDTPREDAASRGHLVAQFLKSDQSSHAFLENLVPTFSDYNPFNLMVYDGRHLLGFEGRGGHYRIVTLAPGDGGVSNADFNTPWYKQTRLQTAFAHSLAGPDQADDALLDLLLDARVAPHDQLPQTGLPLEREMALSSVFVRMAHYGTRASSVVRIGAQEIVLTERGFDRHARTHQVRHVIAKA
jgi:uncharacterized protein with NRDE domain